MVGVTRGVAGAHLLLLLLAAKASPQPVSTPHYPHCSNLSTPVIYTKGFLPPGFLALMEAAVQYALFVILFRSLHYH